MWTFRAVWVAHVRLIPIVDCWIARLNDDLKSIKMHVHVLPSINILLVDYHIFYHIECVVGSSSTTSTDFGGMGFMTVTGRALAAPTADRSTVTLSVNSTSA